MLTGKPSEILVVCADLHIGSTVGLCPPEFHRSNRDVHLPGVGQRALWAAWVEIWQKIAERKRLSGATVYCAWNGDIGDLNVHSTAELITTVKADVQEAMQEVAALGLAVVDTNFVIRGTPAHAGPLAELEEQFAADIGAEKCAAVGTNAWPVLPLELSGVRFEIAHRPPCSTKRADYRNQTVARAAGIQAKACFNQRQPPAWIYVWNHTHYSAEGSELGCWGFQGPPLMLVGAYGFEIGVGTIVEPVGVLVFEIANREWRHEFIRYSARRIQPWTKS